MDGPLAVEEETNGCHITFCFENISEHKVQGFADGFKSL